MNRIVLIEGEACIILLQQGHLRYVRRLSWFGRIWYRRQIAQLRQMALESAKSPGKPGESHD